MKLGREFDAYQEFVLGCKVYWSTELFHDLRGSYEEKLAATSAVPKTAADVDELFEGDTLYEYFAWFERHLQRMKYSGRHGLAPSHEPHRDALTEHLNQDVEDGLLELDPDMEMPRYFTTVDIHQHPGGIWEDELGGVVYERGARSTTPLTDKHLDLHHRFTTLTEHYRRPRRLLDLGCGFGKSTRAFYSEFDDAEIVAIDIAAPCLKLAAVTASEDEADNITYRQARAEDTGLDDESFDVVTSTMLIHEMPPKAIVEMIAESHRLLEPGGVAVHLDFLADDEPFKRFLHYGHSRRNNEPYMPPLNEMDLVAAHEAAGFSRVEIMPFEEAPGALSADNGSWRFPWSVVVAHKD